MRSNLEITAMLLTPLMVKIAVDDAVDQRSLLMTIPVCAGNHRPTIISCNNCMASQVSLQLMIKIAGIVTIPVWRRYCIRCGYDDYSALCMASR
jgi:hypothetical protein